MPIGQVNFCSASIDGNYDDTTFEVYARKLYSSPDDSQQLVFN